MESSVRAGHMVDLRISPPCFWLVVFTLAPEVDYARGEISFYCGLTLIKDSKDYLMNVHRLTV